MSAIMTNARRSLLGVLCLTAISVASAQELPFNTATIGNDTAAAMSALAQLALVAYKDNGNRDRYLDNLFRVQMVGGRYADATKTLTSLRTLRRNKVSPSATAADALYAILATAKQETGTAPFDQTFQRLFPAALARLDDPISALAIRALGVNHFALDRNVARALDTQKGKETISLGDALQLIKAYQIQQAFRTIVPLGAPLVAADDERRYIIERNLQV